MRRASLRSLGREADELLSCEATADSEQECEQMNSVTREREPKTCLWLLNPDMGGGLGLVHLLGPGALIFHLKLSFFFENIIKSYLVAFLINFMHIFKVSHLSQTSL